MKFALICVKLVEEDVFCNPDMMEIVIVTQIINVRVCVILHNAKKRTINVRKITGIVIFITVKSLIIYVENSALTMDVKINAI